MNNRSTRVLGELASAVLLFVAAILGTLTPSLVEAQPPAAYGAVPAEPIDWRGFTVGRTTASIYPDAMTAGEAIVALTNAQQSCFIYTLGPLAASPYADEKYGKTYTGTACVINAAACGVPPGFCNSAGIAFDAVANIYCPTGYQYTLFGGDFCYPTSSNAPDQGDPGANDGGNDGSAAASCGVGGGLCGAADAPMVGDPINASTGNKYLKEDDLLPTKKNSVWFSRYYNSDAAITSTTVGANWRHTYDRSVAYTYDSYNSYYSATVYRADGHVYRYGSSDQVTWTSAVNLFDVLSMISNGSGTPAGWYLKTADGSLETYDSSGRLISIADRGGRAQTLTYGSNGFVSSVTDIYGRSLQFSYNSAGQLQTLIDPAGLQINYGYDANGNLISVQYQDQAVRTYVYNEQSLTGGTNLPSALTGIIDENGPRADGQRFATNTYAATGKATSTQHGNGVDLFEIAYPETGSALNEATVTDPLGTDRTYYFNSFSGQYKIRSISAPGAESTCPACNKFSNVSYDANGFVNAASDGNGIQSLFTANAVGLIVSHTEVDPAQPSGQRVTTAAWDSVQRLPLNMSAPGWARSYAYTSANDLQSVTMTDTASNTSRTTTYGFNSMGLVTSIDGPRTDVNDVTSLTYDGQGNISTVTNALNQVTTFSNYTAYGDAQQVVDPNGVVTQLAFDARRRLISKTVAGAMTTYSYFPNGLLASSTGPTGVTVSYGYDSAQRLTDTIDNLGNRLHYTLDGAGNRIEEDVYNQNGTRTHTLSRIVNPATGWVSDEYGANGQHTQFTYDGVGNLISSAEITSGGTYTTTNTYDALNRLSKVVDPKNNTAQYQYDILGTPAAVIDFSNLTTSYSHNAFGDLLTQSSPDTGSTTFTPDPAGNVVSQTDARPITTTSTYDALNRVLTKSYPTSLENVTYFYDGSNYASPQPYAIGRLTGVVDQSGSTTYYYNPRGTLAKEVRTVSGVVSQVAYGYDASDALTSITYPDGTVVSYVLDGDSRVSEADFTAAGTKKVLASSIQYAPFGPWTSLTLGNGITTTRTLDADYRISSIVSGSVLNRSYGFDQRNDITSIADGVTSSKSQTLTYDELHELITAIGTYGSLGYAYNGSSGDRASATSGSTTLSYSYNTNTHELSSAGSILNSGALSYSYDAEGNATKRGNGITSPTYTYNSANRLSAISGSSSPDYLYNAFGQRVSKAVGATLGTLRTTTLFGYGPGGVLLYEMDQTTQAFSDYMYLNGEPLAFYRTPVPTGLLKKTTGPVQLYFAHNDHLGTPQVLTDASKTVAWSADYQPFGLATVGTATVTNNLRLPGQYFDSETSTHYNGFRTYEPTTGRYIQSDPVGLNGGINTYAFVSGSPTNLIDRFGLAGGPPEVEPDEDPREEGNETEYRGPVLRQDPLARVNSPGETLRNGQSCPSYPEIRFGGNPSQRHHAFRHLPGVILPEDVEDAIRNDLGPRDISSHYNGTVIVGDQILDYVAYPISPGVINVGRITPAR